MLPITQKIRCNRRVEKIKKNESTIAPQQQLTTTSCKVENVWKIIIPKNLGNSSQRNQVSLERKKTPPLQWKFSKIVKGHSSSSISRTRNFSGSNEIQPRTQH